jgi:hypothetical protein
MQFDKKGLVLWVLLAGLVYLVYDYVDDHCTQIYPFPEGCYYKD